MLWSEIIFFCQKRGNCLKAFTTHTLKSHFNSICILIFCNKAPHNYVHQTHYLTQFLLRKAHVWAYGNAQVWVESG